MRVVLLFIFMLSMPLFAQVRGVVVSVDVHDGRSHEHGVVGASVYWLGTNMGTMTDGFGEFSLPQVDKGTQLVVSFVGYSSDTIVYLGQEFVRIELVESLELQEVEVVHRKKAISLDNRDAFKIERMGEEEFRKAACCNLSESFETNPSVDVVFTDAVTGARQIQMLGLSGSYVQITKENMPGVRGLATVSGLTFIPGAWLEGVQLSKGVGSVVNGYEGMVGQVNAELRKAHTGDDLHVSLYVNQAQRSELNVHKRFKVSPVFSTSVSIHGITSSIKFDNNGDGFLDELIGDHVFLSNRWKWRKGDWMGQFGVTKTYVDKYGGQVAYDGSVLSAVDNWGFSNNIDRYDAFVKIGRLFEGEKSAALQMSVSSHQQQIRLGSRVYMGEELSFYQNFILQNRVFDLPNHKYRVGFSNAVDRVEEQVSFQSYARLSSVSGVFAEYTQTKGDQFTAVVGLRADYHNYYGVFYTPRLHLRYSPSSFWVFRGVAGLGSREANVIVENIGFLASSRDLIIESEHSYGFGLEMERSQNVGLSVVRNFKWWYRDGVFTVDLYRTDFMNQIVVDVEQSNELRLYNLDGSSYSNSFQAQFDYELMRRFDVRLAYRFFDVNTTYRGELKQKPLQAVNRAFVNLSYETRNGWSSSLTVNRQGQKRIPSFGEFGEQYSEEFYLVNAQVNKEWKERLSLFYGVENLMNVRQQNPIYDAQNPFGNSFDASMVWGPIFGRMQYVGLRYSLK